MEDEPLKLVQVGGLSLVKHRPIFSSDGKLLLCISGNDIKAFSTETGLCVQRLIGHTKVVTGITLNPKNPLQAISSSLDGSIKVWDYEDGILLKTCDVGEKVFDVYSHPNLKEDLFVITYEEDVAVLLRIPIEKLSSGQISIETDADVLSSGVVERIQVGFLLSGKYIAFCRKGKLRVQDLSNKESYIDHKDNKHGDITCAAYHPEVDCVVTGHTCGNMKVWNNVTPSVGKSKQIRIIATHQWHSNYVQDVAFTSNGNSILSHGPESVLVEWHYKDYKTKRNFLPRLGSPGRHILVSRDGTIFASTHRDNSILIITNYFTIKLTIEGFTAVSKAEQPEKKIMEYDWKTRSCVTTGKPGHLLFYQPGADKQLYNLDITHENYISNEKNIMSIITHVAFSESPKTSGKNLTWMATIDESSLDAFLHEQKLKLWLFDETEQWWKLNTVINHPHKSAVSEIIFQPRVEVDGEPSDNLLTVGMDGAAKLWGLEVKGDDSFFWCCHSVVSYRGLPGYSCDFSQDGSLACVSFGHTVCIVSTELFHDLSVLLAFDKEQSVEKLLFGRCSSQHMLMVSLGSSLHACNLLDGSVKWTVDLEIVHLSRDPLSNIMGCFSTSRDLYVFRPSSPLPVCRRKDVSNTEILGAVFIPNIKYDENFWLPQNTSVPWMQNSRLFFVNKTMGVYTLCPREEVEKGRKAVTMPGKLSANLESVQTPLASVLLQDSKTSTSQTSKESQNVDVAYQKQLAALRKVTDTPAHVLPPISTLCKDFISAFLPEKKFLGDSIPESNAMEVSSQNAEDDTKIDALEHLLSQIDVTDLNEKSFDFLDDVWE